MQFAAFPRTGHLLQHASVSSRQRQALRRQYLAIIVETLAESEGERSRRFSWRTLPTQGKWDRRVAANYACLPKGQAGQAGLPDFLPELRYAGTLAFQQATEISTTKPLGLTNRFGVSRMTENWLFGDVHPTRSSRSFARKEWGGTPQGSGGIRRAHASIVDQRAGELTES